jgi:hypothetical protein
MADKDNTQNTQDTRRAQASIQNAFTLCHELFVLLLLGGGGGLITFEDELCGSTLYSYSSCSYYVASVIRNEVGVEQ